MIVALASSGNSGGGLAQGLAALRASSGNRVLLITEGQRQVQLQSGHAYDDVVIDASGSDGDCGALAVAGVIVVLVRPDELEAQRDAAAARPDRDRRQSARRSAGRRRPWQAGAFGP